MLAYIGDLGMDTGVPQSVYAMDKANMTLLKKPDGKVFRVDLQPGQTVQLPDGAGLGHLRRRRALDPAADQPYAGRAG